MSCDQSTSIELRIVSLELARLTLAVHSLTEKVCFMSAELDRLTTEVAETKTVIDSAITLLSGLSAQIRALKDDPAKLAALADDLDAKQQELAAAVTVNTTP